MLYKDIGNNRAVHIEIKIETTLCNRIVTILLLL